MKKAWRITFNGLDGIAAASTRGQAHAMAWRLVKLELGYRTTWGKIRVVRAPKHDAWAEQDSTGVCWDENLLPGGKYEPARRSIADFNAVEALVETTRRVL